MKRYEPLTENQNSMCVTLKFIHEWWFKMPAVQPPLNVQISPLKCWSKYNRDKKEAYSRNIIDWNEMCDGFNKDF